MFTFANIKTRVASRLNKSASDATTSTRLGNEINDTCLEKWHGYAWSFRHREYPLVLTPRVTSGTVTATNGSPTVTASGTPFDTSLHVGAWIRFTGDTLQAWYRVQAVASTSSLTIEPNYQGTTGGSKTYELIKTDYLLPSELTDTASIKVTVDGCTHTPFHPRSIYTDFPPLGTGHPTAFSIINQSQALSTYTTGTVSGSSGSVTLTGVGTAWLANVTPGDDILINGDTNTYRVYSVESDTSLTLYNKLTAAASGDTYSISRQFGKILRVWPASDNPYVIFVNGLRAYAPLVNSADSNEMLVRFPHAVSEGAIWREAGASPDPREDSLYMRSERMWQVAQSEDEQLFSQHNPCPIWDARQ